MKSAFFSLLIMLVALGTTSAQRFAIVDVAKIMDNMEEYTAAQKQLDQIAAKWRQEISEQYDEVRSLYNKYQAEQVLLSDDERKAKEEEITAKEKEVMDLQKQRFGQDGDLFRKRQELVQPIQDRVQAAISEYADQKGYDAILDKSINVGILYVSDDIDKTKQIMAKLGIKAK